MLNNKTQNLIIKGAIQNNLNNLSIELPLGKFVSVIGVSGSGKSSLITDILAHEGNRLFLESIPDFQLRYETINQSPEYDSISNLPPVIRVGQVNKQNYSKSTLGTLSDLSNYLQLLYSRFGDNPKQLKKGDFSFNSVNGCCSSCSGIGFKEVISINKLVVNDELSIREGALAPTLPDGYIMYSQVTIDVLNSVCEAHGFNVDKKWRDLSKDEKSVIFYGSERLKVPFGKHSLESRLKWTGIKAKPREEGFYKGMLPIMSDILRRDRNKNILKYVDAITCEDCQGKRYNDNVLDVLWNKKNIHELSNYKLSELQTFFESSTPSEHEIILTEKITNKLSYLNAFGLSNYSISTPVESLSSGDIQRLHVVNQLDNELSDILYIFDEPSIGLNKQQTTLLYKTLRQLCNKGNSVIVVEHDLNVLNYSDWVLEIGPEPGNNGGHIVYNGPQSHFENSLSKTCFDEFQSLEDLSKSSNYDEVLSNKDLTNISNLDFNKRAKLFNTLSDIIEIDDKSIGKNSRSNLSTYTGLSDLIRDIFSKTEEAKSLGLKKSDFSSNTKGGRCPNCEGTGLTSVGMSYLGKVHNTCSYCHGKRFNDKSLKAKFKGLSIDQIYDLSVNEAIVLFEDQSKILNILNKLAKVNLGYIKLGQASSTLSGGESQRIRLVKHLCSKSIKDKTIIIHEPSSGLHYNDVKNQISFLNSLLNEVQRIITFDNHILYQQGNSYRVEENTPLLKFNEHSSSNEFINISGASTNNLKDLDLNLEKNKLICFTGISGSGKSSLLKDSLYSFAKNQMLKNISSYQRNRINSDSIADVKSIRNCSPVVFISHKNTPVSNRSTLGTISGINKSIRYLFSRKIKEIFNVNLSASDFSFNDKNGMCLSCSGIGLEDHPNENILVQDKSLSIQDGLFTHNSSLKYYGSPESQFMAIAQEAGVPLNKAFNDFTRLEKDLLFDGAGDKVFKTKWVIKKGSKENDQILEKSWKGLNQLLKDELLLRSQNKNIEVLKSLFTKKECSSCKGSRYNNDLLDYKVDGLNIHELGELSIYDLRTWFSKNDNDSIISKVSLHLEKVISELINLDLGHLQLNRRSSSLSGGEHQRVQLSKFLNSPLIGITYILDEPSTGLDSKSINKLNIELKNLVNRGNTVLISEHNKQIIKEADMVFKFGPSKGMDGGEIIFTGTYDEFIKQSATHPYFSNSSSLSKDQKNTSEFIDIPGFKVRNIDFNSWQINYNQLNLIKGHSGSGKTTYLKAIHDKLKSKGLNSTLINQDQIKSLSNIDFGDLFGLYSILIDLFTANIKGLKKTQINFKHKNGRCPSCLGKGKTRLYLDVESDIYNICSTCNGSRFNADSLTYQLNESNISEVFSMNSSQLKNWSVGLKKSKPLMDKISLIESLQLDHVNINLNSKRLSTGELQRCKLSEIIEDSNSEFIFIDEPSIGLSYWDIDQILKIFNLLMSKGKKLIIAEHNQYLIDHAQNILSL